MAWATLFAIIIIIGMILAFVNGYTLIGLGILAFIIYSIFITVKEDFFDNNTNTSRNKYPQNLSNSSALKSNVTGPNILANQGDHIHPSCVVVGVRFSENNHGCYYYLSDNYYRLGDIVEVPTQYGTKNAKIVFVKRYQANEKLPHNYNALKKVIGIKHTNNRRTYPSNESEYDQNIYIEKGESPDDTGNFDYNPWDDVLTANYDDSGDLVGYDLNWVDDHWEP